MADEPTIGVSVVVEVTLSADDDQTDAADPPDTTEATDVAVAVVGGAAKLVGKVLGAAWDIVKPSDSRARDNEETDPQP